MLLIPFIRVAPLPGAAAMAMESGWLAVLELASTACTVQEHVWAVVGVPETVPVELPKLKPAHKLPLARLQVTGAVQFAVPMVCE